MTCFVAIMKSEVCESDPMTREEAKRILRRLELDAYSAIITAFRAQGDINKSKKSILNELSNHLSISTERHRAEVRRAVNDDRLNAVAECMHGSGTSTEWAIEGRRLVSLMPRLVPQTVFTAKATAAANQAVESNNKLPIKTEIEVVPLPTKPKNIPPKNDRAGDVKDETKLNQKPLIPSDVTNPIKSDDKCKKKRKQSISYSKPSPIALNKTLTNPFKQSTPSLKPIIRSGTLKHPPNYSVSRTATSTSLITNEKYSPKPIILQKSPTKTQSSISRSSIHLQSLNSSNINTPLTSLSSLSLSKGENSLHLTQSPMIKVVSNSLNSTLNSGVNSSLNSSISSPNPTSAVGSFQNNSITQKIKFKTPLPKPKVKATKFKPIVPLQRPGLLSSSQTSDVIGITTSSLPVSAVSPPIKSTSSMQGMSVKVVQVAKSGSSLGSSSLINYSNKPVVVVSSTIKPPPHKLLSFSSIANTTSQTMKVGNGLLTSHTVTSTLPKGTSSKSMPLATGFKMIAVTTVVPGTTQVKTVYIATPIMSLTKTVSQTTSTSITTPGMQNKHNSLATNLQSVVARSMNAAILNQTGKYHGSQHMLRATTIASSITTPTFAVGKTSQVTSSVAKGLGSLRTTLSGAAQSLKVFTAVSKNRTTLCMNNSVKNTPLLPCSTTLSMPPGQQLINNLSLKNTDVSSTQKTEKLVNTIHQNVCTAINTGFLNTDTHTNSTAEQSGSQVPLQATLTLNVNNFSDDSARYDEGIITSDQMTASAIAETDDMAFLNAGEKFLEQLSAKMTATLPDSLNKSESFIFPSNVTLDMSNEKVLSTQPREVNKSNKCFGIPSSSSDIPNCTNSDDRIIMNKINGSQLKYLGVTKNENNFVLNSRGGRISSQLLNNNLSTMNSKLNAISSSSSNMTLLPSQVIHKTTCQISSFSAPLAVSISRGALQQKVDLTSRTVLNYPSMSKDISKVDQSNNNSCSDGFPSQRNTLITCHNEIPSLSTGLNTKSNISTKLHVAIPGNSKLNITPFRANNGSPGSIHCSSTLTSSELFTPIKSVNNSLFSMNTFPKNSTSVNVSSNHNSEINSSSVLYSTPTSVSPEFNDLQGINMNDVTLGKKRKLSELSVPPRTQASWIRGAANLLARVCRFRGSNKQKGDMNAASWFTKPVDPNDAPGYYRIIRNPMDFGKIRRKLEDGEYDSYPDFHDDMMLIKKNCYAYNPVGHIARKDCDDVFEFFEGEYQKLLERWEKHHVSPLTKKIKTCTEENGSST